MKITFRFLNFCLLHVRAEKAAFGDQSWIS